MITHVAIWRQHVIWGNDTIYALPKPNRHHDIFPLIEGTGNYHTEIQGFLDDQGNFLDRREAFKHAVANMQLKRDPDPKLYQGIELYSEDLW